MYFFFLEKAKYFVMPEKEVFFDFGHRDKESEGQHWSRESG